MLFQRPGKTRSAFLVMHVALLVAAIIMVLTGCAPARPAPAVPAPDAGSAPSAGLAPYYAQRPAWKDCGQGFQCAKVRVPLDYDDPDGRQITLAVNRLPELPGGERIGSLILNPGGPGGSGVDSARSTGPIFDRQVRKRFDVVGFDPRGVGESTPVRCLDPADFARRQSPISVGDDEKKTVAMWRTLAGECGRTSGWLLPHVGTDNVARDMDVLRAVLGDRRLNYLGWSYGTELGAAYADLFPAKVRVAVLDSAVDPAAEPMELAAAQAKSLEVALRAFTEDCLSRDDCPFRSRTPEPTAQEIAALVEAAEAAPLNGRVDGELVLTGIAAGLYAKQLWPVLRKALGAAFREKDGELLAELGEGLMGRRPDGTWSNQMVAGLAIRCADWPRTTRQAAEAAARQTRDFRTFGRDLGLAWVQCRSWPVPPPKELRPIPHAKGSAPILVIGTLRDPATPYSWSVALTGHLDNARLLTYDGDGHGVYLLAGSNCVDDAVDRYLIHGELPRENSHCPAV
ncbi:alpha/beta hydrolase [Spongiactinospora sp. 9N601]|uniref:alpha/beta hydrolase n=1 Tax=Spongiactinospora sp. 9N601 TaxID=3375149 RepID=UPI0037B85B86